MRFPCLAMSLAGALVSLPALGHGPQMQITNDSDKIVTREVIPEDPVGATLTAEKSAYVIPILKAVTGNPSSEYWYVLPNSEIDPILNVTAYQFGPGLAYGYGHTFAAGEHFNVNFTDTLRRWDGTAFSANPGPEEIGAFRGGSTTAADTAFTTDHPPYQGLVFSNISPTYNAEAHSSMRFRVLGDGTSALVEPADGIYRMQLQITSTQPGLASSDPFYFVLYKNPSPGSLDAAVANLAVDPSRVQYVGVPEPASGLLAVAGLGLLIMTQRRLPSPT